MIAFGLTLKVQLLNICYHEGWRRNNVNNAFVELNPCKNASIKIARRLALGSPSF